MKIVRKKRTLLPFLLLFLSLAPDREGEESVNKSIDGVGFVAPRNRIDAEALEPVSRVHADWISVMPLAYGKKGSPALKYDLKWQWWGEKPEGVTKTIQLAQEKGFKVFLKPQLWLHNGAYTGDLYLDDKNERLRWEIKYEDFMLRLAGIADSMNVEMFAVGTEMEAWTRKRPDFWKALIKKVRMRYEGELTYAANWDNYQQIPFWDELDCIGINAYFPLSGEKTPSEDSLMAAWQAPYKEIRNFRDSLDRAVLFTEYGYRSVDKAAVEPWNYSRNAPYNAVAQANSYRAIYRKFWTEDWFKGGFLWKWYGHHQKAGGRDHTGFTPQNKDAEDVIRRFYRKW